jgi:hypothetical protein
LDWQQLSAQYLREHGRPLAPVRRRGTRPVPRTCRCIHCGAPPPFLYLNDGRQANCAAKSVVACRNWRAAIVRPALPATGVPAATAPFTAGNNVLTAPSTSVLAITALTTSRNSKL